MTKNVKKAYDGVMKHIEDANRLFNEKDYKSLLEELIDELQSRLTALEADQ